MCAWWLGRSYKGKLAFLSRIYLDMSNLNGLPVWQTREYGSQDWSMHKLTLLPELSIIGQEASTTSEELPVVASTHGRAESNFDAATFSRSDIWASPADQLRKVNHLLHNGLRQDGLNGHLAGHSYRQGTEELISMYVSALRFEGHASELRTSLKNSVSQDMADGIATCLS